MKSISGIFLFTTLSLFAQRSEDLVPRQAVTVFTLNNINLLQQISLDDLVQYEFMEELQQELFDGSTSGKTIKDSGIDFDQKLNVFNGKGEKYTVNGFTFGIANKDQLFETFDDFTPVESPYSGVELYVSYFNRIAIKGDNGILFRIAPTMRLVDEITDSIWYARGNDYPWYNDDFQELFNQIETQDENVSPDMEIGENTVNPENNYLPVADEDPDQKTYYELRDSVDFALQESFIRSFSKELFEEGKNLLSFSPEFKEQLTHSSEAILFSDNSRRIETDDEFWYMRSLYPTLFYDVKELYENNMISGDLRLSPGNVGFHIDMQYSEELGSIYSEMTRSKFDKHIVKYLPKDASAFFTYNIDMLRAYRETYNILVPILEKSDDMNVASDLMIMELLDILLDESAVFGAYKGSMFGTYSDIKKIKTKKIIFDFNEETFEYSEQEVEAEEDMPLFTVGFTTDRTDLIERILKRMTKLNMEMTRKDDFWIIENAILNAAPVYLILRNDLLLLTNDSDFAENYSDGYPSNMIEKSVIKEAKKSGALYGRIDLDDAIAKLPKELFSERENNVIDVVRGKNGIVEITSSKTTPTGTSFDLNYSYEADMNDSGRYILDLINSIYVISK